MSDSTSCRAALDGRGELPLVVGIAAVSATKALDVGTTIIGLTLVDHLEEGNVLVAKSMALLGVETALISVSVLTIAAITISTEAARRLASNPSDAQPIQPATIRLVGYGTPSLYHIGIATYNFVLITGG